jgi:hypothetical protein
MRVVWDSNEFRFLAELTPGDLWREDMEAVKAAGFKTTGPPSWEWYCFKASCLNKLRKNKPKSGVVLTELAFEKYKQINQREEQKAALKKEFEKAKKEAKKSEKSAACDTYVDPLWGPCIVVKPADKPFANLFVPPAPPKELCMICDEPIYFYEHLVCLWCEKEVENSS